MGVFYNGRIYCISSTSSLSPPVVPLLKLEQRRHIRSSDRPNINQLPMCKLILKQPLTWKYRCIQTYTLIRKDSQRREINGSMLAKSRVPCEMLQVHQYTEMLFENAQFCLRNLKKSRLYVATSTFRKQIPARHVFMKTDIVQCL